jgi:trimethylamine--corrinoid protein Co-methyltransferase
MVLCDELIGWLKRYLREIEVSEETLVLELIHEIGPDKDFLLTEHTLKHVREDWLPTVFSRTSYERWAEEGMTTLEQRLNQKVRNILENHRGVPLPDDVSRAIANLVFPSPVCGSARGSFRLTLGGRVFRFSLPKDQRRISSRLQGKKFLR